jgi:hypothetical protein
MMTSENFKLCFVACKQIRTELFILFFAYFSFFQECLAIHTFQTFVKCCCWMLLQMLSLAYVLFVNFRPINPDLCFANSLCPSTL